ncbi:Fe(3+)-hydroxamate ABC transporter permease FhuB [Enterobacter sp. Ap-916]|uniref:Fe(3+)-hydroxamate ABC transporter permease FhuB n=1 Tax=unclassified Enterobacter TaxID=2608935 RepID=UPI0014217F9B|nr:MULTISPECIES: Fe(3+)-hydroxamate ABC transporter permease FhuB [unclassified Enterobacter]NIF59358.1 Fe(3+)-hydroxamate ABC transporter permease FhuB [Enterobacter sp. Ap-867]NIG30916.1 Fe(3+)-hydroxamate ABC transporter permease FhuB [Enterobacter sp. Ap-916]
MAETGKTTASWLLIAGLWLASIVMALQNVAQYDGLLHGLKVLFSSKMADAQAVILHSMWFPRQVMALLGGAVLALCGWLMQRALRNPLAEPITLGMTSGATLALGVASMWFPATLLSARTGIVITGEVVALLLVLLLSWRQRLSPLVMIQAGMLVNLWCGSLTMIMAVINDRFLLSVLMWGGGSLAQQDWSVVTAILPWLGLCGLALLLLLRPLALLRLPEAMVSSLGASPLLIRSVAMALALVMSALIINSVGVIGFIGLAAPHLARLGGARTTRQMLSHSLLIGAGLLWFTDLCVSRITLLDGQLLPVGMLTALTGGPLLILLAGKARHQVLDTTPSAYEGEAGGVRFPAGMASALLLVAVVLSLFVGQGLHGWHWTTLAEQPALLPMRLPRLLAALSAGALLAAAGVLMQRVSGNPLASPEILGIGGGAAMGVTAFLLLFPTGGTGLMILSSAAGALISLLVTLWSSRQSAFNPQRVLLNGLALNALFQAIASIVMLNNRQASSMLLQLMTGSTYYVNNGIAIGVFFAMLLLLAVSPLCKRWLLLLPLGQVSGSLGVNVARARISVLALAALMTGLATLIVGPVSFVGLLGPHLARKAGAKRPMAQLFTAALLSALIMVLADWMGRNFLYPRQLPVGLVASLVGVPLLVWPLIRSRAHTHQQ